MANTTATSTPITPTPATTTTTTATTTTTRPSSTTTLVVQVDPCRRSYTSDDDYANMPAVCECGRTLMAGWQCNFCRRNCPFCHRALTTDPQDYCDRCFRLCNVHGLYHYYNVKTGYRLDQCPSCRLQQ